MLVYGAQERRQGNVINLLVILSFAYLILSSTCGLSYLLQSHDLYLIQHMDSIHLPPHVLHVSIPSTSLDSYLPHSYLAFPFFSCLGPYHPYRILISCFSLVPISYHSPCLCLAVPSLAKTTLIIQSLFLTLSISLFPFLSLESPYLQSIHVLWIPFRMLSLFSSIE